MYQVCIVCTYIRMYVHTCAVNCHSLGFYTSVFIDLRTKHNTSLFIHVHVCGHIITSIHIVAQFNHC